MTDTKDALEEETVATPGLGHSEAPEPADAAPEEKVCVNCGAPAVYESPADGNMDVVQLCAKHKPVNAPKKK